MLDADLAVDGGDVTQKWNETAIGIIGYNCGGLTKKKTPWYDIPGHLNNLKDSFIETFGDDEMFTVQFGDALELITTTVEGQKFLGMKNDRFIRSRTYAIAHCFDTFRRSLIYVNRAEEVLNDPSFAYFSIVDAEGHPIKGLFQLVRDAFVRKFPKSDALDQSMEIHTDTICYIVTRLIVNAYIAHGTTVTRSRRTGFFRGEGCRSPSLVVPRTGLKQSMYHSRKNASRTMHLKYSPANNGSMACSSSR
jgi:hypothetical protein